jgi:hypothetical protein
MAPTVRHAELAATNAEPHLAETIAAVRLRIASEVTAGPLSKRWCSAVSSPECLCQ